MSIKRPVGKFDYDTGKLLEIYESVSSAARANWLQPTNISACCTGYGNARSAGGWKWKHMEASEDEKSR